MSMFTAHKDYQRPSEVELTRTERVDWDFIVATNQDIDADAEGVALVQSLDTYLRDMAPYHEKHAEFRRKYEDRYPPMPEPAKAFMDDLYGPDPRDWPYPWNHRGLDL